MSRVGAPAVGAPARSLERVTVRIGRASGDHDRAASRPRLRSHPRPAHGRRVRGESGGASARASLSAHGRRVHLAGPWPQRAGAPESRALAAAKPPHLLPAALSLLHRNPPPRVQHARRHPLGAGRAWCAAGAGGGSRRPDCLRSEGRPRGRRAHGRLPGLRLVLGALLVGDALRRPALVGARANAAGRRERLSDRGGRRGSPLRAHDADARAGALPRAARGVLAPARPSARCRAGAPSGRLRARGRLRVVPPADARTLDDPERVGVPRLHPRLDDGRVEPLAGQRAAHAPRSPRDARRRERSGGA